MYAIRSYYEPKWPTADILKNEKESTTYYDWVRSYKLVPVK